MRWGTAADEADAYVRRYVAFVTATTDPGRLLDVGCGGGWSTLAFQRAGYSATGLDLHETPEALAAKPEFAYVRGDASRLPFEDSSFDVVASYQALEHMDDPRRVLEEAHRVLCPGGRLVVVGPNLESAPLAVKVAAKLTWRRVFRRTAEMPRHPYGNTAPEAWRALGRILGNAWPASARRPPRFRLRQPDLVVFHADSDATWFCNPSDILAWGRTAGMRPVRWWSDRLLARMWWRAAAGTWVVLEKGGNVASRVPTTPRRLDAQEKQRENDDTS